MPTVALASEFLDAFARLPRAQQKKVREFTEKFKADPRSPAINYEKIHQVKDDKVRTVRIGLHDRAVVQEYEERERSLLFVAATRARDRLVVTGWGSPSPFMPSVGP
jgi:superfamily I DNA/RNA helicase